MSASPNPRDADLTATNTGSSAPGLTDASGPADATIVRGGGTSPTLTDVPPAVGNSFGKYELLGELARGGMGVVYRARQPGLDRVVALKMVLGSGGSAEAARRFLQEAQAAAALDHPNVVPIYDTGEIDGKPYFTMALIEGPNLKGHVEKRLPVPIPEVVSLFAQIVAGVAHAHQADLIHRDLKPANVLIDRDGRARVTDFGLAKRLTTESQLTQNGQVLGTPHYMAPEQARDSRDVGKPADVYALGAILHFMLTGKPPFHAESYTDLLIKLVTDPPVPPQQQRPDVPDDLNALCLLCLAKEPSARPADALQLAEALAPILDHHRAASSGSTPALARLNAPLLPSGTTPSFSSPQLIGGTAHDLSTTTPPVPTHDNMATRNVRGSGLNALPPQPAPAPAPVAPAPKATEPEAKASKLPLILGGVAAVLVAVAAVAFALKGSKKPDETAQQQKQQPDAKQPDAKQPDAKNPVEWPAVGRADFGLAFEVSVPGMQKQADGSLVFPKGAQIAFTVKADRDCHVSIWSLDADGTVSKLFPNKDEQDDLVRAGAPRALPGNKEWWVDAGATNGAGFDRLRILATTGAPPEFPPGVPAGKATVFAKPEEKQLVASAVRGAVLKSASSQPTVGDVAEAEVRFRVPK
jgi:eukaryotic-like serine/threonine-protein kinase